MGEDIDKTIEELDLALTVDIFTKLLNGVITTERHIPTLQEVREWEKEEGKYDKRTERRRIPGPDSINRHRKSRQGRTCSGSG